ncbi:hypothetical protein [Nocardiopsis tropica]|uniref:Secreted protein n=1 Tax=Nocardiopsis tropica TaxID=109330 RepID=A0ABU7KK01_9ACTN|nr:hypothetical protein [Nocardiopsis umidischolae]MEE2049623.1 hypothetical protein [Nocardiopsis umidischolae]
MLLSVLFVAHFLCAVDAMDTAAAAEAEGTAVVAGAAWTLADVPVTDGTAEEHHLCQAEPGVGADQRAPAIAKAVLSGLGAGTTLLQAPSARTVPWQPSTTAAGPWSGTRLLFSLCVQRV